MCGDQTTVTKCNVYDDQIFQSSMRLQRLLNITSDTATLAGIPALHFKGSSPRFQAGAAGKEPHV